LTSARARGLQTRGNARILQRLRTEPAGAATSAAGPMSG
jgi:hypothetical protein